MIREAKLVRFDKFQCLHQKISTDEVSIYQQFLLYKSLLPRMATLLCVRRVIREVESVWKPNLVDLGKWLDQLGDMSSNK